MSFWVRLVTSNCTLPVNNLGHTIFPESINKISECALWNSLPTVMDLWVSYSKALTAHNWQKCKSRISFQLCFKNYNSREGNFVLNQSSNLKFLSNKCDTYKCDYLPHTIFRFYLIDSHLNTDFPSEFCVFANIT